jgi:uncharacterized membrane protein
VLAYSQNVYDLLKLVHVLAAIIWVGSGVYFQFQATRLRRAGDGSKLAAFALDVEFAGKALLGPASGIVLTFGILMVWYAPQWSLSDAWILIGLGGAIATGITGTFFLGPSAGRIGKVVQAEGLGSPNVAPLIARILTVSRIDQVVLLVVIWAMVFKPGS